MDGSISRTKRMLLHPFLYIFRIDNPKLMRTAAVCCITLFLLASCGHSGSSGGGSPVNDSYLASIVINVPGAQLTDSFSYTDQKRVARFAQYLTNNSNTNIVTCDFSFSGNSALPDSYTYAITGGVAEVHQLTYDGQGRITKDTCGSSNFVTYYLYSGNYIVCNIRFEGTPDDSHFDTLTVQNGDITNEKVWTTDFGPWQMEADLTLGHATAANPGYKAEIAGSVGPLLYVLSAYNFGGYSDFISKTIVGRITGTSDGVPPGGIGYTPKVDAKGRVSSVTATGAGVPLGIVTAFTYY